MNKIVVRYARGNFPDPEFEIYELFYKATESLLCHLLVQGEVVVFREFLVFQFPGVQEFVKTTNLPLSATQLCSNPIIPPKVPINGGIFLIARFVFFALSLSLENSYLT